MTPSWIVDGLRIGAALLLVLVNGFFVAAEFALVKIRPSRVDVLVHEKRPFAETLRWLVRRLDASLSACQLGITMASLGLGWIGEPAVAHLIRPIFESIGIQSPKLLHASSFVLAFSLITSAHIVAGEQAPKIYAIRRPERLGLWCAAPLRGFYVVAFPFLWALNWASSVLLRLVGMRGESGHEAHHTEEELRVLLEQARIDGELSRSEHQLLNAVFEFDDLLTRQIMVPRGDVVFFDLEESWQRNLEVLKATQHTRYPVCRRSLDELLGVIHIKDLVGLETTDTQAVSAFMRPPHRVPESMSISRLLRHFQRTRQHLAFVVDEHGTIIGIVTLENVLERIVGEVEDEFDHEPEAIVPTGSRKYLILGTTPVEEVERQLKIDLGQHEADTLSGLLVEHIGRLPVVGDRVEFERVKAEVVEVRAARAHSIEIELPWDRTAEADEGGQAGGR